MDGATSPKLPGGRAIAASYITVATGPWLAQLGQHWMLH